MSKTSRAWDRRPHPTTMLTGLLVMAFPLVGHAAFTVSSFASSQALLDVTTPQIAACKSKRDPNTRPSERYAASTETVACLQRLQGELRSSAVALNKPPDITKAAEDAVATATNDSAEKSFAGLKWGVGVGYSFGKGPRRIDDAEVVNNVVRVKTDSTNSPRLFLETHYLFEQKQGQWGWGPFVSIETGSSSSSSPVAFGGGLMIGFKDSDPKSSAGFLLAVGYEMQSGVKTLGDGIEANQPLPPGETQVRFKTVSAGAIVVMLSRKFASP